MTLIDHARRELGLIGVEQETIDWYIRMIEEYQSRGQVPDEDRNVFETLNKLMAFQPLTPLTDDPEEWMQIDKEKYGGDYDIWQNIRNSEAFSRDGGKTHYLLSDPITIPSQKKGREHGVH